jgi:hypothetical protein
VRDAEVRVGENECGGVSAGFKLPGRGAQQPIKKL